MKKSRVGFLLSILLFALLPRESLAVITIYIHPDGASSRVIFEMSGQFDNPNNVDTPTGLSSFAVALPQMYHGPNNALLNFASPLATITDVTRNTSSDIVSFYELPTLYFYLSFAPNHSLPMYAGDVLSLTSHGPQTMASLFSYSNFVPGDYTFTNPSLGPTTFQVHIVPEPSALAMMGVGLAGWAGLRRRSITRLL